MQHPEHDNAVLLHPIEHSVRKSGNKGAAHVRMQDCEALRIPLDGLERRASALEKALAESCLSHFVVLESRSEIAPDLTAENDAQRH